MKQKLNCILLIDDDESTNFIHERIIRKADCTERVAVFQSGYDALDFLKNKEEGECVQPDLIFLDINMPAMDGWEFIEAYDELDEDQKGRILLVMLTTSMNPDDEEKARQIGLIKGFLRKPLTQESLMTIVGENFPDKM